MEKPIRVLMVNYKMQCAGIESFIMNVYRNIDRSKIQFDFLVHYQERQFYDDEIESMGGNIYRLTVREDNNFLKYFCDLKKFFSCHPEYKIIHGHMESFGVFYLKAAKTAGVPVRIAHSHIAQRNKGIKGAVKNVLNKGFKKYATDLFACSDVAGTFLFGSDSSFTVYNNAIDVSKFAFNRGHREAVRKELGIDSNCLVIGHVGRFNTQKNHEFLIEIFKEIICRNPQAKLLLIGEGDLQGEIEKKVGSLGLNDSVLFLGVRKDIHRIYQAMDVFLMPSLFEGLPVSGIEAQASGLQCIFSDAVTVQTKITDRVQFISLDTSIKDWADKILELNTDIGSREQMAQYVIDAGYDIKQQVHKLENFYLDRHFESRV